MQGANMMREEDAIEQFRRAMAEKSIMVDGDIIADGKFHRIHVSGDRKQSRNGWYTLHMDGTPAGAFGCNKRYGNEGKFTWKANAPVKPLTPQERREYRQRMQEKKAAREAEEKKKRADAANYSALLWNAASECEGDNHPYLKRKGVLSFGLRVGRWEKVDEDTGEVRVLSTQALMVPIRDLKKNVHSLQAIFTGKIYGDRDKDFVKGGAKEALFYTFGKPLTIEVDGVQRAVIMIGEGYATLASAHMATGHAAVVAFDAGNLQHVAKVFRERFPDAVIIILADNDQWTETPVLNPGVTHARKAAELIGGLLAVPGFDHGHPDKPTDFNDMHRLFGLDAVSAAIGAVLTPPPPDEPLPWEPDPLPDAVTYDDSETLPPAGGGDRDDDTREGENQFANNLHFRALGVDEDVYFFFKKAKRNQVLKIRTGGFSISALMSLAPLNWWEGAMMDGTEGKFKKDSAVDYLMQASEAIGRFDPDFTRRRGAWMDEDRLVVHLGDRLLVDGEPAPLGSIESEYLYEGGKKISPPHPAVLTADEGKSLMRVASMFRWARPASAHLLCGWLLLSPLCGALRWRPHAWVTGGAGAGKTTIINDFVRRLIPKGMEIFANGDSSEAGLRQALRSEALPILIDESESDTDAAAAKMQRILVMLRQSSSDTGAQTFRGTVTGSSQSFQVRSMALLSSIGVSLERQQDRERVIVLSLRPKRDGSETETDVAQWPLIRAELNKIGRDSTISARLFARAVSMSAKIIDTIDVFTEAAAQFFGTAREGDQIGALMAGAWCLGNDEVPTHAQALAHLQSFDWADYQEEKGEEKDDLIASMMGRVVILSSGYKTSIGKLVARAAGLENIEGLGLKPAEADAVLHNYGMKVKDSYLWLHTKNEELQRLMRDTKFSSGLHGRLRRIEGGDNNGGGGFRIGEVNTNGLRVPLAVMLAGRPDGGEPMEPGYTEPIF